MNKIYFSFILFVLLSCAANAQQLKATLDSSKIKLGGQAHLKLELSIPKQSKYLFPIFTDTIAKGIELVGIPQIDTIKNDNQTLTVRQQLTITSWDSGSYQLPKLKVVVDNGKKTDTLSTQEFLVQVSTVKVDTTKAIRDIKAQTETPFSWVEWADWLKYLLLAWLLIGLAFLGYLLYKKRKTIPLFNKPKDPPYVVALSKLSQVQEVKIWQQGKHKEYHSDITDTLRQYLEDAFKLPAMEKTSDEILQIIRHSGMFSSELQDRMRVILTTADFAKFAKAEPLPDENETSLAYAIDFVERTKPATPENTNTESV